MPHSRTTGLVARALRTRWLVRLPIPLYRAGLGWLLGTRLIMVEHVGRVTGARRLVVLEVVGHPGPGTFLVVSGFGPRAAWYRNLVAHPAARVWVGRRRGVAVTARPCTGDEADVAFDAYVRHHRRGWERLRPVVEDAVGHPVRRGSDLTIVRLDEVAGAPRGL